MVHFNQWSKVAGIACVAGICWAKEVPFQSWEELGCKIILPPSGAAPTDGSEHGALDCSGRAFHAVPRGRWDCVY